MKTRTLTRIGVLSAAKLMGLMYAALGLIGGSIITLLAVLGMLISSAGDSDMGSAFGGALFGVGAIVLLPIFYGVMGFVGGAIMAAVYNLGARWTGGLELEISDQINPSV